MTTTEEPARTPAPARAVPARAVPAQRAGRLLPPGLEPPNLPLRVALWMASRSLRVLGRSRYGFADALGLAIYARTSPARRQLCADNHRRLAPSISVEEARRRARYSYREFMRMSFDFMWEYAVSPQRMRKHYTVGGLDHVWRAMAEGKGGVFVLAHYGSWDVAALCALSMDVPLTTVMTKVGDSELATRIAAWARRHQDMEVLITGRGAARGLISAVRRRRFDAILADIPEHGGRVLVDFCGGPVNFSSGPAWISRTTGAPILCVDCFRNTDGRYRMVIHPPDFVGPNDTDQDVMQRVAQRLEQQIRRMPTQWYPFGRVYQDTRAAE
jgi:KDO2-lipid IV(A) lauroyltransferase